MRLFHTQIIIILFQNPSDLSALPEGQAATTRRLPRVRVEPRAGLLNGKSVLDCKIYITPSELGELSDIRIPCYIKDMEYPLFVELSGVVKGVSVNYYFTDSDEPTDFDCPRQFVIGESRLDFGSSKVGQVASKSLIIQNNSGIYIYIKI